MSINNASATGTQNKKRDIPVAYSLPQTESITTYVRPADWLTMPTVLSTDQKIVLLVAVENCSTNFFAVTCTTSSGTYTIDWGDGTPNSTTASNSPTYHNFDWNNVSSGTLTTRGYRQVIVTITPTTANLTSCLFTPTYVDSSVVSPPSGWNNKILESVVAGSSLIAFQFGGGSQSTAWMEQSTVLSLSSTAVLNQFYTGCRSLVTVVSFPNGNYTNISSMFSNCFNLQVAPLFTFATTGSVNMNIMFSSCFSLVSVPLYNTVAVTNMGSLFQNCYSLLNAPFFNTINVTDMSNMFSGCFSLTSVPPYNTGNVTTMGGMFNACTVLKTVPTFNTIKVTNTSQMFNNCQNFITAPPFNLVACTNASSMYAGCFSLESAPPYNLPVCTNIGSMYINCYSLATIGTLTTSGLLTNMSQTFTQCRSLITAPAITNTTNVTNMAELFYSCYAITTIPVYDTANVTTMNGMFAFNYSLKNPPAINTIKATNFQSMFQASGIVTAPLYDTSNVTNMTTAFYQCRSLTTIPVYNTSKVTNMNAMIQDTTSLVEFPALDTSNVTNFSSFALNSGISRVSSSLNTNKATNITSMFSGCVNLVTLPTTLNFSNVTSAGSAFNNSYPLSIAPSNNLKVTTSYATDCLGQTALQNVFTGLGTPTGATQTLTITGNPGTVAAVAKTIAFTGNSAVVSLANTVGLSTGMHLAPVTNVSSNISVTFTGANSCVALPMQLPDNTIVSFSTVTSNVVANTIYYTQYNNGSIPNVGYKLRTDPAGANILLTSGTAKAKVDLTISSINPNVSITLSGEAANSLGSASQNFRTLNTNIATFKNWTVTG